MAAEKGKQDLADTRVEPSFLVRAAERRTRSGRCCCPACVWRAGTDGLLSTEVGIGAGLRTQADCLTS